MADRILELKSNASETITKSGYSHLLEDDYISSDLVVLTEKEVSAFKKASIEAVELFRITLNHIRRVNLWDRIGINEKMASLIKIDLDRKIPHALGRFDFSGGIDGLPIKLIEYNADTCTMLPESAYFQQHIHSENQVLHQSPFNALVRELSSVFKDLKERFPEKPCTLLLTSLGAEEDVLNLKVVQDAAESLGWAVDYADLEEVVFADEGVFLKDGDSYIQYFYMYKLVPWEFMMFEEPELLDILIDHSKRLNMIILNPSYTLAFQSKQFLEILYETNKFHPLVLKSSKSSFDFKNEPFVEKVNFGRMGENIRMWNTSGQLVAATKGDFGSLPKSYQGFAEMYKDEDGDTYQAGVFVSNGTPSCISFRRQDSWIINDDAEFVSHAIAERL